MQIDDEIQTVNELLEAEPPLVTTTLLSEGVRMTETCERFSTADSGNPVLGEVASQ